MKKEFLIQAVISLLVGAAVFFLAAPHSWGLGIFYQEMRYAGISIGISLAMLLPVILLLFRKKKKYFFSLLFFSFIGILLVAFLYPAHDRYSYPSDSLKEDVEDSLHKAGMPLSLRYSVHPRRKVAFDMFVEHEWEVTVWGKKAGKSRIFTYIEHFDQSELKTYGETDWSELTSKPQ